MEITYTTHIKNRLLLRKIDSELPKVIYEQSQDRYFDNETGHTIAVMRAELYNKDRDVMVAYEVEGDRVKLLTIHPLKEGQKEERVSSRRWRKM